MDRPIARIINLIDAERQRLHRLDLESAEARLRSGDPEQIGTIEGSFALVAREGEDVYLARSLDRPMRYFLAKEEAGPMLLVAERIDELAAKLSELGYGEQFHPSYTRMVPAHHVTHLRLVGCPDPREVYTRFFDPPRQALPPDLDVIGERYVEALLFEVRRYLEALDTREPIGVCFSGGIDSGAVLVALHHSLIELGQSGARLKAFTLEIDGGSDAEQARDFLRRTGLEMLGETIQVGVERLDPFAAIEIIEDYKPLDVECATVGLALLAGIRERYSDWLHLVDGDGGDENLKDYPIEENNELTIRSVVNNLMLYQEGWGVDSIKHSLTYSGGLSRACVRTTAPCRHFGFDGFSPFTRPSVIAVAEAIPFDELTRGSHQRLYALKGEVMRRGMKHVLGVDFPVFEKRRFQHGATSESAFKERFDHAPELYRQHFHSLYLPSAPPASA